MPANVSALDETRATSHVSLREAVEQISIERICDSLRLSHDTMLMAGIEKPRIAVAALNPHADTGAHEAAIRLAARIAARKKSPSGSIAA
jgi:4-hydroxy-L-threonine phosphate dehydrogenase PdxA